MRIDFRYGGAVGMLAAAFGLLGPVTAQANQISGTSVPTCAGTCGLEAPAAHLSGIARTSIALTSVIKSSSNSNGYAQARLGLPGQRDRLLQQSDRCGWWYGQWRCGDFDDFYHHHHRYYHHHGYYGYHHGYGYYGHGYYGRGYYGHYGHGRYGYYGHGRYGYYGHGYYGHYGHGHYGYYGHSYYGRSYYGHYGHGYYAHYGHGYYRHYR